MNLKLLKAAQSGDIDSIKQLLQAGDQKYILLRLIWGRRMLINAKYLAYNLKFSFFPKLRKELGQNFCFWPPRTLYHPDWGRGRGRGNFIWYYATTTFSSDLLRAPSGNNC